jgi:hypothetical protein
MFFFTSSAKSLKKRRDAKSRRPKPNATIGFQEKGVTYMTTWSDYKNHVRTTNPEIGKDIDEVEALSQIVGAMIE